MYFIFVKMNSLFDLLSSIDKQLIHDYFEILNKQTNRCLNVEFMLLQILFDTNLENTNDFKKFCSDKHITNFKNLIKKIAKHSLIQNDTKYIKLKN